MALEAIEEMKSFLVQRYLVNEIFSQSGEDRNKTVLMYCKDIALYHLYCRHHSRVVPDIRTKRYEHALQWLKDVQDQKFNPVDLPNNGEGVNDFVKAGSNDKRENYQK